MLSFLNGLDNDIKTALISQIRNLWTHSSTAIEGNTLTLGETAFVIEEGLTVSGKPLKDHQEVVGHARAIDLIYSMVDQNSAITKEQLFDLHQAVQTSVIVDIYKPVGAWKKEPNGTYMVCGEKQIFFEYASPSDVPALMEVWLDFLNSSLSLAYSMDDVADMYAELHLSFVHIHPFFDGNGRIARLISNLPVLKSGFPPILIPKTQRRDYIRYLSQYEAAVGTPTPIHPVLNNNKELIDFKTFCKSVWQDTLDLLHTAQQQQNKRQKQQNPTE